MGFKRFIERLLDRADRDQASGQERRVVEILGRARLGDRPVELHDALLAELPASGPLHDASLARITVALRGLRRDRQDELGGEHPHLEFWKTLRERFPDNAYLAACYGEELLGDDQPVPAMAELLAAFALDPGLFVEFGDEIEPVAARLGGETWLRYRLSELRARLEAGSDLDEEFEEVREQYSELLEEYAGDAAAMKRIRALGRRIDELTAADQLPRAIVRRGNWRSKPRDR